MRARVLGAAALLLVAGCAAQTKLRPTPEAGVLQNGKSGAITEQQGVRLVADSSAWQGAPYDLERRLTPIYIRLENQGDRPLRVQYPSFALVGQQSRFRYSALPLVSLRRAMSSRDPAWVPPSYNGVVAPSVSLRVGPGAYAYGPRRGWGPRWYGPWWGSPFYDPYLYYGPPRYVEPLPTADMINNALPEGTLEPGGTLEGFLYFQGVVHREDAVTLQMNLVDAQTGEPFGTLAIPFQVSKG
ncbi:MULTISPECIES: hypothetical protein [Corallococcus]|uniref:hypothetical protein n=1 Tax=Corallococcus TaxID=83461 RepID=UPI0011800E4F|nr:MULTISPECIES: hypothetical protein [Corallococcus]NBD10291.1 hypothetical protein [Corallococcus silvisoli]TSC27516.1 hypothetical protein FOF48_19015 [Corallococcus sp. Z5C101001]